MPAGGGVPSGGSEAGFGRPSFPDGAAAKKPAAEVPPRTSESNRMVQQKDNGKQARPLEAEKAAAETMVAQAVSIMPGINERPPAYTSKGADRVLETLAESGSSEVNVTETPQEQTIAEVTSTVPILDGQNGPQKGTPELQQQVVMRNAALNDGDRVVAAGELLKEGLPDMTDAQRQAILDAHNVDGEGVGHYTREQLRQKAEILAQADPSDPDKSLFNREQRRVLMENGIVGNEPTPPMQTPTSTERQGDNGNGPGGLAPDTSDQDGLDVASNLPAGDQDISQMRDTASASGGSSLESLAPDPNDIEFPNGTHVQIVEDGEGKMRVMRVTTTGKHVEVTSDGSRDLDSYIELEQNGLERLTGERASSDVIAAQKAVGARLEKIKTDRAIASSVASAEPVAQPIATEPSAVRAEGHESAVAAPVQSVDSTLQAPSSPDLDPMATSENTGGIQLPDRSHDVQPVVANRNGGVTPPGSGAEAVHPQAPEQTAEASDWEEYLNTFGDDFAPGRKPGPKQKALTEANLTVHQLLDLHGYGTPRNVYNEDGTQKKDAAGEPITRPTTLDDIINDIQARKDYNDGHTQIDKRSLVEKRDQRALELIKSGATRFHEEKVRAQIAAEVTGKQARLKELQGKTGLNDGERAELAGLQNDLKNADAKRQASIIREAEKHVSERGFIGRRIDGFVDVMTAKGAKEDWKQVKGLGKVYRDGAWKLFKHRLGRGDKDDDLDDIRKQMADVKPLLLHSLGEVIRKRGIQGYLWMILILGPAALTVLPAFAMYKIMQQSGKTQ